MVKKNACIFISGAGTNLKVLIKSSREYNYPINIKLIISSTKKAKGLNYAKIYNEYVKLSMFNTRVFNTIRSVSDTHVFETVAYRNLRIEKHQLKHTIHRSCCKTQCFML